MSPAPKPFVLVVCAVVSIAFLLACAGPGIRTGKPVQFTEPRSKPAGEEFPHWTHPPLVEFEEYEAFNRATYEVVARKGAGGGVTGASKVDLRWHHLGRELRLKSKRAPDGRLDGWNNAPRKEMAADRIQQLFLDPMDFVVPSTGMICVPMALWEEQHGPSEPSLPGIRCVVSNLSFGLQEVTVPDQLYDEQRFLTDPDYAWHLANFNILP